MDFSVPAFLSSAMTIPVTWISNAMLIRSPGGYAEMGIYNAANQMRTAATYIPGLVGRPHCQFSRVCTAAGIGTTTGESSL